MGRRAQKHKDRTFASKFAQGAEISRFRNNTIIKKAGPVNKIL